MGGVAILSVAFEECQGNRNGQAGHREDTVQGGACLEQLLGLAYVKINIRSYLRIILPFRTQGLARRLGISPAFRPDNHPGFTAIITLEV